MEPQPADDLPGDDQPGDDDAQPVTQAGVAKRPAEPAATLVAEEISLICAA